MSGGKFASLTAGLLVRRGEARQSEATPRPAMSFASAFAAKEPLARVPLPPKHEDPQPVVLPWARRPERCAMHEEAETPEAAQHAPREAAAKPSQSAVKPRRLMVTVSPGEHETLGLIAVKKGVTRHQLLRNALDEYLALLVEEYSDVCSCINTGCACSPA